MEAPLFVCGPGGLGRAGGRGRGGENFISVQRAAFGASAEGPRQSGHFRPAGAQGEEWRPRMVALESTARVQRTILQGRGEVCLGAELSNGKMVKI